MHRREWLDNMTISYINNHHYLLNELRLYFNGSEKYKQSLAKKISNIIIYELLEFTMNPNRMKSHMSIDDIKKYKII